MEQSSWEANRSSVGDEIPRVLWNTTIHYRIYTSLPLFLIQSQMNPVHDPSFYFLKIYFDSILPFTPRPSKWPLSFRFPHQTPYAPLLFAIRATCPAYPIIFYLITRMIFGEHYTSLNFKLFSPLDFPITLSLVGPNIFLSTVFWNILSLCSSLCGETKCHTHIHQEEKLHFWIFYISIFIRQSGRQKILGPNISRYSLSLRIMVLQEKWLSTQKNFRILQHIISTYGNVSGIWTKSVRYLLLALHTWAWFLTVDCVTTTRFPTHRSLAVCCRGSDGTQSLHLVAVMLPDW